MNMPPDVPGDAWTRRVLDAHFERHPVDATYVGLHEHDDRLPDPGPRAVAETVDAMRSLLADVPGPRGSETGAGATGPEEAEAPTAPIAGYEGFADLDRRLTRGFLSTRLWEYGSGHVSANPSALVGDAVFGLMAPLLTAGTSGEGRSSRARPAREGPLAAVQRRLAAVPAYLESAVEMLTSGPAGGGGSEGGPVGGLSVRGGPVRGEPVPAAWTRRAIRECHGALAFLSEGLDALGVAGEAPEGDDFAEARRLADRALRSFSHFLETELLPGGSDDVACGGEAFDRYLRDGHFLDRSADEVVAYARDEMLRTRAWLEQAATDFGASSPEEVVAGLADLHPTADGYLDRYHETWEEMRGLAVERDLLTWPDFPIEYVERPNWARAAAPDLYFLFYRSPPAFQRTDVHRYMVAPLDPDAGADEVEAFLGANNDSVIKLNHVVHHGGIGHHVQNWHAFRSPSLVGRLAAVDCASRIAMFCGGTMAEGWACYATDLMAEAGGLTDRERFAEHHGRVRMCARAIVDVELHHGRMSLDEAAAFYRESAGMSAAAAEGEAVKNSIFPGAALIYLVGADMIHELRADLLRALGDDFMLRDFHDAFLSYGSIPVSLIAGEMRRRAEAGLPLGAHEEIPVHGRSSRGHDRSPGGRDGPPRTGGVR